MTRCLEYFFQNLAIYFNEKSAVSFNMSPEPEFQTKRMNRKLNLSLDITSSSVNIKTRNRKV